jgi:hypothetical protein
MATTRREQPIMRSKADAVGYFKRSVAGLVVLCALVAALAIAATPASALRVYESAITEVPGSAPVPGPFGHPNGVAVDGSDNLWVSDTGQGVIDKFNSSAAFLTQATGEGGWAPQGSYVEGLAFGNGADRLYVADSNHDDVWIVNSSGAVVGKIAGSDSTWGEGCCSLRVGVDNSGGAGDGDVYIASGQRGVFRVNENGDPVDFTASASYISGNHLTGTPEGEFSEVKRAVVGPNGHIYVLTRNLSLVHIFASSGEYLGTFNEVAEEDTMRNSQSIAIDPSNGNVLVSQEAYPVAVWEFDEDGNFLEEVSALSAFPNDARQMAVNSGGKLYVTAGNAVRVLSRVLPTPKITYEAVTGETQTAGTLHATIDPNEGGPVTTCTLEYGTDTSYGSSKTCTPDPTSSPPGSNFTTTTAVSAALSSLTPEQTYHYRFVAGNANVSQNGSDQSFIPHWVIGLKTNAATDLGPSSATLHGSFSGNGAHTTYHFDWGTDESYGSSTPELDAGSPSGSTAVQFDLNGLEPVTTYHVRIVARNPDGESKGGDEVFITPPLAPVLSEWVTDVHSDSVLFHANINPGGGTTKYHVEYVPDSEFQETGFAGAVNFPAVDAEVGTGQAFIEVQIKAAGLAPDTTYHYRVVAGNSYKTTTSEARTFATFPFGGVLTDTCQNALERKQSRTALLLDCRAYELVSASSARGYDVVSDVVPGQAPLPAYPDASSPSRVLYTVNFGALPGSGDPTNFGNDPYVAARGEHGWSTHYVGLSAKTTPSTNPFATPVALASSSLSVFAFGGGSLCDPCFPDGTSGIPVRLADGSLVQGMAGSLDPGPTPLEGLIAKPLSADGSHLIFGSTAQFESDASTNGDASLYERNLETGTTQVISKAPDGSNLPCLQGASSCHAPGDPDGIAALDVSTDGSRVVVAQKVAVDAAGNRYWHPYMHVGNASMSIDLAPGTSSGVLYAGMSSDGTKVYFTSKDQLGAGDDDSSADLYRADVGTSSATLTRISVGSGGSGNSDACTPSGNSDGNHWNAVGMASAADCGTVAVGGGGGVASGDGTVFFMSPEQLDGEDGTVGEPNLYAVRPGAAPRFVGTVEPDNPAVRDAVNASEERHTADFQVVPSGDFAAFSSRFPLTGYDNDGHVEVYRYEASAPRLDCASCAPTGVRATDDAALASNGNSITNDGRLFFTSGDPLAPRDLNGRRDAYEWENGAVQLISSGSSQFESGLFSVSRDGTDAYFFTRDVLVPQDENGATMKIYDARENGGFFFDPAPAPCQASDECHGPGSVEPPPPDVGTYRGIGGNVEPRTIRRCRRGVAKRHSRCLPKRRHRHRARRRHG